MPDLNFRALSAEPMTQAASPHLILKLLVRNVPATEEIHTVTLQCQIRIEPAQRRYNDKEKEGLVDLFGAPERWGQTLRSTLWTHASVHVPSFQGETGVDLPVPCTYDFNVASTKYFNAIEEGHVPLTLLFSGTMFYSGINGMLQVSQIAWNKETRFELPVQVWKEMMCTYYPNSAWLCLRKDVFDRLHAYKMKRGLPTWEQVIDQLVSQSEVSHEHRLG